ncbi:MAG: formate dehydrogenase subunit alpha [Thermodesulfobacteriota bacterium]
MAGLAASFGSGAMTNSVAELEDADCIFVIGSNTTSSHPIVATRIFRAQQKGAKLIVADPRRIQLAEFADVYVQQKLGSDVALLNSIMQVILEQGWQDQEFIESRTEGFEELQAILGDYTPQKTSEITGVSPEDIQKIAELYGRADKASLVYCMGITQHVTGVDNVKTLANLAMLTGNVGRESTGVNPLRGQNNVQGACDMGGLPNVFSGYQAVTDPSSIKKMSEVWGATGPDQVGLALPEMISGAEEGSVRGFYVLGENPVQSDPDSNHVKKALESLDFLVVQDMFLTPTAQLADVVLPGASFAEKDGTFTNTERRVMRVRKAIEPEGESRSDWEIIQDISTRLGYPMQYSSPEEIMQEISKVTPSYGGISYDRLEGDGLQWPCPDPEHPGTKFLHQNQFARGKGLFHAIGYKPPAESVDQEYPFWLTTGRVHAHYHTSTMTGLSPVLQREAPESEVQINPQDAQDLQLQPGDFLLVSSRRGQVRAKSRITDTVPQGTVFMSFHYLEGNANVLTNTAMDPIAKIPELKVCAVRLEKAELEAA